MSDYKHFLDGKELNKDTLSELLDLSDQLKTDRDQGLLRNDLKG